MVHVQYVWCECDVCVRLRYVWCECDCSVCDCSVCGVSVTTFRSVFNVPQLQGKVHYIRKFHLHCLGHKVNECGLLIGRLSGAELG